jgi:hypothetical protein
MGTTTTATAAAGGGGNGGSSKGLSATFVVVLLAVLLITIGSLVLSLREGDRRRAYEDQQYQEIQNSEPKGETSKDAEPESLKTKRDQLQKEVESMQKTQDSLMGVFLLGSGAVVGLLTGKLIS